MGSNNDYLGDLEMEKKLRFAVKFAVLCLLVAFTPTVLGSLIVYDDGKNHTISEYSYDVIEVKDSQSGTPTTVNLVYGGEVSSVNVYGNSSVNLSGGVVHNSLNGFEESLISISNGSVNYLMTIRDNSEFDFSGGFLDNLELMGMAHATMSGGEIWSYLQSGGSSNIMISGGTVRAGNGGVSSIRAQFNSRITVDGSDFNYPLGSIAATSGVLACELKNGGGLNNNFEIDSGASIILVPEPNTLIMFGFGIILLKRKSNLEAFKCEV